MTEAPERSTIFEKAIVEHQRVIETVHAQVGTLERIAGEIIRAVTHGGKVLWCGNGGSAADAQHMAAELVGRFRRERKGLASIALTTDTSILTAVGNDYGFEEIFRRQVEALCARGDVVVGISTSGNSRNVCLALEEAKRMGAYTVAFTGQGGGAMIGIADATIAIPSKDTARIQEAHALCGHMLCDWVEACVCSAEAEKDAVAR
jgi:D-sedoheptulose 7-phosphate isomerase